MYLNPQNSTMLPGHDFAASPEAATGDALRDMAYWGIGHLTNVFDEDELRIKYSAHAAIYGREDDTPTEVPDELDDLLAVMDGFIFRPEETMTSAIRRYRNGNEGWHRDTSFCKDLAGSYDINFDRGVRMLAQVDGTDGYFAAATTNRHMIQKTVTIGNSDFFGLFPNERARFIYAPYLRGSVVLLPEAVQQPLQVLTTEQRLVQIEHPYHTGIQDDEDDGFRTIIVVDKKMGEGNFIHGLDIPKSRVRVDEQFPDGE